MKRVAIIAALFCGKAQHKRLLPRQRGTRSYIVMNSIFWMRGLLDRSGPFCGTPPNMVCNPPFFIAAVGSGFRAVT